MTCTKCSKRGCWLHTIVACFVRRTPCFCARFIPALSATVRPVGGVALEEWEIPVMGVAQATRVWWISLFLKLLVTSKLHRAPICEIRVPTAIRTRHYRETKHCSSIVMYNVSMVVVLTRCNCVFCRDSISRNSNSNTTAAEYRGHECQ